MFESKAAADASRTTEVFAGMTNNPAFADLSVVEYSTLETPTRITTAGLDSAAGDAGMPRRVIVPIRRVR